MVTISVEEIIGMVRRTPKPRYETLPYYTGGYKKGEYDYNSYQKGKKNWDNIGPRNGGYEEEDDEEYWERHEAGGGKDDEESFHQLVEKYPRCVVSLLMAYGISISDLKEVIQEELGISNVWD